MTRQETLFPPPGKTPREDTAAVMKFYKLPKAFPAEVLADDYDLTFGNFNVIFPNSVPLLKELRNRGYITGVITNGPANLQGHKLEMSGLMPYLDTVVISGAVGVHKPDPELFRYTADKLGLKCEECVYVGDHPINDIKGALDAGMRAIRMNFGWLENQMLDDSIPTITDIIEVLKYLE